MDADSSTDSNGAAGIEVETNAESAELELSYAYDEDPIADETWIREYERECEERQQQFAMLRDRLQNKTSTDEW